MSNLGSYGSQDYQSPDATLNPQTPIIAGNDPHAQAAQQAQQLFLSPKSEDHTLAMKMLLAMMSKGYDASEFSPFVVQQVASQDAVSRQLAYVYLNHYAAESPETSILSINTFQRSLTDSDPIVRALAIKVMSSIRSKEILPAIQNAVVQVIGDPSPYVKKAAAYAMIKASEMEPNEIPTYIPLIERLLGDSSPIAFSGAIAAYWSLCPDNIELLHPYFKSICQNIKKLDEWSQMITLRALTTYSRYCFRNPDLEDNDEDVSAFWLDTETKEIISPDHLLLIHSAKQLLNSPNPAVVMAAVSLLFYTAPSAHISSVARPLVRLLYEGPTVAQIALSTILTIASVHNYIFVPHINHFFVKQNDSSAVKQLKLRVLSLLASPSNAEMVLNELSLYTGSSDIEFAATAVRTMGKTSMCSDAIIPQCLTSLIKLMSRAEGKVLSEVVLVIAHILRKKRGTEDETEALHQLCRKFLIIKEPRARAAVLSIVGDMYDTHPEFAPQLLRHVANNFLEELGPVKLQALTLSAKLISSGIDSKVPLYVLKIGERDSEYDVRDRAKFLLALISNSSSEIKDNLKNLLFPKRLPPQWTNIDNGCSEFQIGTFSHYFNRAVGDYEPLPDWAPESELPDESVRAQAKVLPDGTAVSAIGGDEDDVNIDLDDWFTQKDDGDDGDEYGSEYSYSEEDYGDYSYEEEEPEANQANDSFGFFD
ncbi:Adaptin N terminal region family protein [Histomonas meleagridis]|uniref:Adaptin N terminal region family protein n=1 Tax=Histomonas meleagridis TaxID=135588 RepID=UPI00355A6D03|nr:Adaptin N terminal region family protein [Histomonas meleagridis]KAH0803866.1 Adaptin N terminal region family protein [Histomonas meleagridis]